MAKPSSTSRFRLRIPMTDAHGECTYEVVRDVVLPETEVGYNVWLHSLKAPLKARSDDPLEATIADARVDEAMRHEDIDALDTFKLELANHAFSRNERRAIFGVNDDNAWASLVILSSDLDYVGDNHIFALGEHPQMQIHDRAIKFEETTEAMDRALSVLASVSVGIATPSRPDNDAALPVMDAEPRIGAPVAVKADNQAALAWSVGEGVIGSLYADWIEHQQEEGVEGLPSLAGAEIIALLPDEAGEIIQSVGRNVIRAVAGMNGQDTQDMIEAYSKGVSVATPSPSGSAAADRAQFLSQFGTGLGLEVMGHGVCPEDGEGREIDTIATPCTEYSMMQCASVFEAAHRDVLYPESAKNKHAHDGFEL